jgi:cobalt-precorrin 5A hydrolase
LIISDHEFDAQIAEKAVIYRPKTLVAGIGLHGDTTKEKIITSLHSCLEKRMLSPKSLAKLVSLSKPKQVQGLLEAGVELGIPVQYFDSDELAKINIPNPSNVVVAFEGTPSVSEAAAIKASSGRLVVEKQKFPPDLTIAVARIEK